MNQQNTDVQTITLVTSICGIAFGLSGLVLGILNYIRDRSRIAVTLTWDMSIPDDPRYDPAERYGLVRVTNTGRRAAFISIVALAPPKGSTDQFLILSDSIKGTRLGEGDPPAVFTFHQHLVAEYAAKWREIRAVAEETGGKKHWSKRLKNEQPPSWAQTT